jgi:hypothetical protein
MMVRRVEVVKELKSSVIVEYPRTEVGGWFSPAYDHNHLGFCKYPQTGVGGWFKSRLRPQALWDL